MVNYDNIDRNQVRERECQGLDSGMAPARGKLSLVGGKVSDRNDALWCTEQQPPKMSAP